MILNILNRFALAFGLLISLCGAAVKAEDAPDFSLVDMFGETVSLSELRGKPVILEWTNHDCPFVRKHYSGGNMQRLQRQLTEEGAVWLSIISSAPGKQGHISAEKAQELTTSRGAYPSHVLFDPTGAVGKLYGARTTPHMYLIGADGALLYQGAIDDKPSARLSSLDGANNYLVEAWEAVKAGKAIADNRTKPYGCTVKYGD